MAIIKQHSFDEDKIKRYKEFKHIHNKDFINIKDKKRYDMYLRALESKTFTELTENSNNIVYIRIMKNIREYM